MFSQAEVVELDSQGRIVVPETLVSDEVFKGAIVVIGAGDHFEIWEKSRWEEYRSNMKVG
jgi:MraZ protein